MPRQSRAADQKRLAEEHTKGVGQGRPKKGSSGKTKPRAKKPRAKKPAPAPETPKRKRGRPPKSDAERVSAAWDVLRKRYSDEAHEFVSGLKKAGLSLDDVVAMEIAEIVEIKRAMDGMKPTKPAYAKLHQVLQQCRKQLTRILVLQGGTSVNDTEIRIPEGLEIIERPRVPNIGHEVQAKPVAADLPERYR